jgi:hypothetical protein
MKIFLVAFILTLIACAYRLTPLLGDTALLLNFAPLMAISLCGGLYLSRVSAWAVPLSALFISDLILNFHYGVAPLGKFMLVTYSCYAGAILLGQWLQKRPSLLGIFGGALTCSFFFYLITNSASWLSNPVYAKTLAGWVQALTMGQPGYPPTWMFFRNSLASDLLYTGLFVGCIALAQSKISFHVSPVRRSSTPEA